MKTRKEVAPDQLYVEYEYFKTRQAKWEADLCAKDEQIKDLTKELKALRAEFHGFRQQIEALQVSWHLPVVQA
jgi:predicted  nucleic acid-binding Zn-ribbon protein